MASAWENLLSYVGLATISYLTYKFTRSISTYALPGTLTKHYNPNGSSWALVTGASDGIGYGFCEELCARGFNVILHGRNRAKLETRTRELAAQFPARKTAIIVLDAVDVTAVIDDVAQQVRAVLREEGGQLSVLVNNIGGETRPFVALDGYTFEDAQKTIYKNAVFMTHITRVLLPVLDEAPAGIVLNISSASSFGMPFLSVYCATKGFVDSFTYALAAECRVHRPNIEILGVWSGAVKTAGFDIEETRFAPSARKLASGALNRVGCGKTLVWAYFWHWVQGYAFDYMPRWVMVKLSTWRVLTLRKEEMEKPKTKTL
ncbi:hypothetical protein N7492_007428 [Penicillium capsulatum]|uniref:Ketoreductase domain-containing protein n=1 Tax=Penicillium capsulatum TaxID=69766 RepID=A0A9W9I290_9EURO|nr:hypothetical protein N7492_007428 [Penicillium capsulatum]KAJ6117264.1 hypothetical protein N7512_006989 [Penicillium capsulatum]